jgi:ABC-2 type transport system permease protein
VTEATIARPRAHPVDTRGATLRAIYIIWYRDVIRYWRDRWRLGASFAQPILFLAIFGVGLSSSLRGVGGTFASHPGGPTLDYVQFMFPGIICMTILFTSIFGAMSIVWDREFGFLKEVLVAPINRSAVAIGKTLGGATQAMLQGLIILVLAPFVGVKLTLVTVVELIPLTFTLAFALSALGVAVASGLRSLQAFQVVINFLVQPLFFLSGALFPLTGLPSWMSVLTRLDPLAYGVDPIRRVVLQESGLPAPLLDRLSLTLFDRVLSTGTEVAILFGFGLVMLSFAIVRFQARE